MTAIRSVAQLEQDILAGRKVTPEDLAHAASIERAAERHRELTRQREETVEREKKRADLARRYEPLVKEFAEIRDGDASAELLKRIGELIVQYRVEVDKRNAQIAEFRSRVQVLNNEGPDFDKPVLGLNRTAVQCGNDELGYSVNWRPALDKTLAEAVEIAKQTRPPGH